MKIIDKYIYREFLTPLSYCFFSFILLFVIGDLFENLDIFIIQKVSWMVIVKYYAFMMPNIFVLTIPLTVLLSILYQLGYMSKNNELTALKASGVNFGRIVVPFCVIGAVLSILLFAANEKLVPRCSMRLDIIRESYLDKDFEKDTKKSNTDTSNKNITFFSSLYNMSFYADSILHGEAISVSIREFNKNGSIKREWFGKNAVWADGSWWLFDGYVRQYTGAEKDNMSTGFFKKQEINVNIPPQDLIHSQKYKDLMYNYMNFGQLCNYIKRNFTPSTLPRELLIELYRKLSIPITVVIVTIFGITFGARISKGGAMASVGYSLMFYIVYYGISSFLLAMGKMGKMMPFLAVWTPQVLFGIISVHLLRKVR